MTVNDDIYVKNDAENLCRTACLWLIFSDRLWPELDIDLSKYDLRDYAAPLLDI